MYIENISEKMLNNRIVMLNGEVNEDSANEIIMKLLYLDSLNHEDIYLYINSGGGVVSQGLAIIDCINYIESKVITVCVGVAYSMAAVILSCGEKGKRFALPNSEIMVHQIAGGMVGKFDDVDLSTKRMNKLNRLLTKIIASNINKKYECVFKDMKKDFFMNSKEAQNYGIIDKIIYKSNGLTN